MSKARKHPLSYSTYNTFLYSSNSNCLTRTCYLRNPFIASTMEDYLYSILYLWSLKPNISYILPRSSPKKARPAPQDNDVIVDSCYNKAT